MQRGSNVEGPEQVHAALNHRADVYVVHIPHVDDDAFDVRTHALVSDRQLAFMPITHRCFLAVVLHYENVYIYWGVCLYTKLLTTRVHDLRVDLYYEDFGDIPVETAEAYLPAYVPGDWYQPFSLDDAKRIMAERLRLYAQPELSVSNEQEDKFGYRACLAAVARGHRMLKRHDLLRVWRDAEVRIAMHRVSHVPHLVGFLRKHLGGVVATDRMIGVDVVKATHMLPLALTPHGRLSGGKLFLKAPLWSMAMREWTQSWHAGNLTDALMLEVKHESFKSVLNLWYREFWRLKAPVIKRSTALNVQAIADIEELQKVMPMCMRHLAEEAFDPQCQHHLKHQDREVFYAYVLGNGMDPLVLTQALEARFEGMNYDTRKIRLAVKNTATFVRKASQQEGGFRGHGCKKLQTMMTKHEKSYCPFMSSSASDARVACHDNQNALRGSIETGKWLVGSPLRFSQQLKQARIVVAMDTSTF